MTDYSKLALGADLSHWQRRPDFGKLEADGVRYVIIKATERMGVDPDFEWNRDQAMKRKMPWLAYPFLRPDDTAATMAHFARVAAGGVPALDWEAAGVEPDKVGAWMDHCEAAFYRPGLAYYGKWPPGPVIPRIERWPRWLPLYPARLSDGPRLPPWDGKSAVADWSTTWMVWQYTGHGRLPGVPEEIDLNRLACPFEVFAEWWRTGELPAAPLPKIDERSAPLHLHSAGPPVTALQGRLAAHGYHIATDGEYGPQTMMAVKDLQLKTPLLPADGIARPDVVRWLNEN